MQWVGNLYKLIHERCLSSYGFQGYKEHCDFICWTPCGMHCEQILSDPKHFFDITKPAFEFFIAVLLPRLLTGSPPTMEKPVTQNHAPNTYCWCGGEDEGKMVACDNAACTLPVKRV